MQGLTLLVRGCVHGTLYWQTCWLRHVLDDMLAGIRPEGVAILAHSSGFFASSWHASDFVELMEESGIVDWSRCWSLHLYNSQTKLLGFYFRPVVSMRYRCLSETLTECRAEPRRFTKDPVELCRDSSYKSGDLCNGLRLTVEALSHMAAISQHRRQASDLHQSNLK